VPHTDHCVWLPVCLQAYLDETDDYAILDAPVSDAKGEVLSVSERITRAMRWLLQRGLGWSRRELRCCRCVPSRVCAEVAWRWDVCSRG